MHDPAYPVHRTLVFVVAVKYLIPRAYGLYIASCFVDNTFATFVTRFRRLYR